MTISMAICTSVVSVLALSSSRGGVGGIAISRASLRSEKDNLNIDIYRGFIESFGLFWGYREPLGIGMLGGTQTTVRRVVRQIFG